MIRCSTLGAAASFFFTLHYRYLKNAADKRRFPIATAGVLLAAALVVILYSPALTNPYRLDDFAWLSLRNTIAAGRSVWWALFSPQAQGTIRPLGERLWFLLASSLFGLNPVPLHTLALCTQIANVALVADTGWRLLGSRNAAAIAAILWVINDTLVVPMVWASASNEVLYTFLFLVAFNAFLRGLPSQGSVWLLIQAVALVLALGTVELAVVFPVIAGTYVLLFERNRWRSVLPSAAIVLAYVVLHLSAVRLPRAGPYKLGLGWGVLANFAHHWATVLGPEEFGSIHPTNFAIARLGTIALTAAILVWVWFSGRGKRWMPVFCLLWFTLTLAPTLPLVEHSAPYYTFLPLVGLALVAGDALVRIASWPGRSVAIACAALYAMCHVPSTLFVRDWNRDRSHEVVARENHMTEAVRAIRRVRPDGPVLLSGLDWEQFWWGLCYGQLTREGFTDLHMLPDSAEHGVPMPPNEWCFTRDFQFSSEETARLLREGRAKVYDIGKSPPVEISYR